MCQGLFNFRSPKFDTSRLIYDLPPPLHSLARLARWLGWVGWLAGLASWLGSLAVQAGLSGRVVRLGCQAGLSKPACGCLAGWPAGLPGLACPPAPPPLQTPQPAQPANSELARRLGRRAAPATPQKAAPKADNQSSLRPNSDKLVAPVVG